MSTGAGMARIQGSRIIPDDHDDGVLNGWAVLVHGRTKADMIFTSKTAAETAAVLAHLADCPIVPVVVSGRYIERVD